MVDHPRRENQKCLEEKILRYFETHTASNFHSSLSYKIKRKTFGKYQRSMFFNAFDEQSILPLYPSRFHSLYTYIHSLGELGNC